MSFQECQPFDSGQDESILVRRLYAGAMGNANHVLRRHSLLHSYRIIFRYRSTDFTDLSIKSPISSLV